MAGLVSLKNKPVSAVARVSSLHWFSISFWSFTVAAQFQLRPVISDFWWGWLLHVGCTFIPIFFLHFATLYSSEGASSKSPILFIGYLVTVAYNLLNLFTRNFTGPAVQWPEYAYPKPMIFYPIYFMTFVAMIAYGSFLLWRSKRGLARAQAATLNFYLIAHLLGYFGGLDNFLIMADIRWFPLYPYGLYLSAFYAGTAAWLIVKRSFLSVGVSPGQARTSSFQPALP
ncbi:MAG: hypothetical protein HY597_06550 [Candidatus Omnitrophica bacterium]|nr:hypothetical protein [Candidatus Omnitrophota bacterium]